MAACRELCLPCLAGANSAHEPNANGGNIKATRRRLQLANGAAPISCHPSEKALNYKVAHTSGRLRHEEPTKSRRHWHEQRPKYYCPLPIHRCRLGASLLSIASLVTISLLVLSSTPLGRANFTKNNTIHLDNRGSAASIHSQDFETAHRNQDGRQHPNGVLGGQHEQHAHLGSHTTGAAPNSGEHASEIDLVEEEGSSFAQTSENSVPDDGQASSANKIERLQRSRPRARRSSSSTGQLLERRVPAAPVCGDCLAIPLVAIVGRERINGFILQPTSSLRQHKQRQREEQDAATPNGQQRAGSSYSVSRQQQHHQQQQAGDRAAYVASMEVRNQNSRVQQEQAGADKRQHGHYDRPVYQKDYVFAYQQAAPQLLPFEPKSDPKCPMTGPLTVCDQIGSYPADVILTRLEGAKKMFGQMYFILDSLFSDESQHSSEPFDGDLDRLHPDTVGAHGAGANSTMAKPEPYTDTRKIGPNYGGRQTADARARVDQRFYRSSVGEDEYYESKVNNTGPMEARALARSAQIVPPTGATRSVQHSEAAPPLVTGERSPRHRMDRSRQRRRQQQQQQQEGAYDKSGTALGRGEDDSSQIMSERRLPAGTLPGDESDSVENTHADESDGAALANDLRPTAPIKLATLPLSEGDDSLPHLDGAAPASGRAPAARASRTAEEFLYLVERKGVRISAGGASVEADNDQTGTNLESAATNLRRPAQIMKLHQSGATNKNRPTGAAGDSAAGLNYNGLPSAPAAPAAVSPDPNNIAPESAVLTQSVDRQLKMARDQSEAGGAQAQLIPETNGPSNGARKLARQLAGVQEGSAPQPSDLRSQYPGAVEHDDGGPPAPSPIRWDRSVAAERPVARHSRGANERAGELARREVAAMTSHRLGPSSARIASRPTKFNQITDADEERRGQQGAAAITLGEENSGADELFGRLRRQAPVRGDTNGGDQEVDPEGVGATAPAEQVQPVCRARSIYISPRAALNDKKRWKYVVNAPERDPRIKQIIRVDICDKQKYAKKKLLALDSRSGLLEVDTFFIPSCCVCQLILDGASSSGSMTSPVDQAPRASDDDADVTRASATNPETPGRDETFGADGNSGRSAR